MDDSKDLGCCVRTDIYKRGFVGGAEEGREKEPSELRMEYEKMSEIDEE